MKYLFVFTLGLLLFFICLGVKNNNAADQSMTITEEEAVKIAKEKIKSFGYDSENMAIKVSLHNEPWNPYLPKDSKDYYHKLRQDKLKGKKYWAVYYYPKSPTHLGGDVCIFIDSQTSQVITDYRGK